MRRASDLLTKIGSWQSADIGAYPDFEGNFGNAQKAIRARTIIGPGRNAQFMESLEAALEDLLNYEISLSPTSS
jgi:homoserine O-acetyltransferase/O-succinyltransferase